MVHGRRQLDFDFVPACPGGAAHLGRRRGEAANCETCAIVSIQAVSDEVICHILPKYRIGRNWLPISQVTRSTELFELAFPSVGRSSQLPAARGAPVQDSSSPAVIR